LAEKTYARKKCNLALLFQRFQYQINSQREKFVNFYDTFFEQGGPKLALNRVAQQN
jgi:hypothetical protein